MTNRIEDNGDGGIKTASVTSNKVIVSDSVLNANAPLITAQPISDTAIIPATRVFSVGAYSVDEGELSYQWYSVIDGTDSADDTTRGAAIDGATEASYKVKATEIGKTGYYCIVTNTIPDNGDGGIKTASVKSETAWFEAVYLRNVVSKPQFTKQPVSMSVAPYNQGVNLTCKAESDGYTVIYRWYESTDGTTSTGTVVIGGSGANTAKIARKYGIMTATEDLRNEKTTHNHGTADSRARNSPCAAEIHGFLRRTQRASWKAGNNKDSAHNLARRRRVDS